MRNISIACFVLVLGLAGSASAQTETPVKDYWPSSAECLASSQAPFYVPTIVSARKLGTGEMVRGIAQDSCVEMQLPDRLGKRGWVRIERGREFVFEVRTGKILRLRLCNNPVYNVVPIPEAVIAGPPGPQGPMGPMGPQGLKGDKGDQGEMGQAAPAPVPTSTAPFSKPAPVQGGWRIQPGIGYLSGSVHSDYSDPVPSTGDVPQKNRFSAVVGSLRVAPLHNGIFGELASTALGKTSGMQFQDITGAWVTKKRDTDTSRDNTTEVKVGYQHTLGSNMTVGGFAGWNKLCLCEDYVAQGATTTTQRSYAGVIVGAEAVGSTDSESHQISVGVAGEFGPSLTRTSWTAQTYPGVTFPKVTHPNESAKSYGVRLQADIQAYKAVHVNVGYDYSGFSSTRPDTFTAHERVNVNALTIGVSLHLGR